jgi:heme oxygenase
MIAGNSVIATDGAPPSFSAQLKQRTQALHVQAECSGFVRDMLRGAVTIEAYALFLRNLLPAYHALEAGLERLRLTPVFRRLALEAVYRAPALEADLTEIAGVGWVDRLSVLPEAMDYADRITFVAQGDGARLLAHAYARTLGDLNGGQVLKRMLARTLGLGAAALSFYDFPAIGELESFRLTYRAALNGAADEIADIAPVIEEAAEAFRLNIALSEAVQRAAASNIILASAAD